MGVVVDLAEWKARRKLRVYTHGSTASKIHIKGVDIRVHRNEFEEELYKYLLEMVTSPATLELTLVSDQHGEE
jgi:hypothetical protein